MLETIIGLLGSAAGGGILGLGATWLKAREQIKLEKLKLDREIKLEELAQASMRLEAELKIQQIGLENEGRLQLAQIDFDRAKDVLEGELMTASYANDKASYGIKFVDAIRGLTRPVLTSACLAFLVYMFVKLSSILGSLESLDMFYLLELYKSIISAGIFTSTTALVWWFGSRANKNK